MNEIKEENAKLNETDDMNLGIGNEEATALKPAKVKIIRVEIKKVGEKNHEKLNCICKHPDKDETLQLSTIKYESKGKLQATTLWFNKDSKKLIQKGSALAIFLNYMEVKTIREIVDKEVDTVLDDKGYLCFKIY